MKKILFVASEVVPFFKTGGLADVVGALPKFIDKKKYDVRVMMPNYRGISDALKEQMKYVTHFFPVVPSMSGFWKWSTKAFIFIL